MKPPCHNRPPFADGRWHATGRRIAGKPVMRWHPRWFEDRCATHDGVGIGPNNENYPAAHGWDCSGCRLDPNARTIDPFEPIQRAKPRSVEFTPITEVRNP